MDISMQVFMLVTTAAAYVFYHVEMLALFDQLFSRRTLWRVQLGTAAFNYLLFCILSYMQSLLVVNWSLIAILFIAEMHAMYKLPLGVSICCAMQGGIIGLTNTLIMRAGAALVMDLPLAAFDSKSNDVVGNYKYYPILIGFILCGFFFLLIRRSYPDWVFTLKEKDYSFRGFIFTMSILFFLYLDLNLYIYQIEGSEKILSIWELKSGVCVLIGNIICIHHVYSLAKFMHYERKKREVQQELLRNQEMGKKLEEVTQYDALTGCNSREVGVEQMKQFEQEKRDFLLAFADLNGLKKANDQYGHDAGDKYLAAVGYELRNSIEGYGMACRYGGDEFLLIVTGLEETQLKERMEEVRQNIRSYSKTSEYPYEMSVSIGIANSREADTAEALVDLADSRMYEQKRREKQERG